ERPPCELYSDPTRRSSDLTIRTLGRLGCPTTSRSKCVTHWAYRPQQSTHSPTAKMTTGNSWCRSLMRILAMQKTSRPVPIQERRSEEHTTELQSRFDLVCH